MESREVEFTAKCSKGNSASNACCQPTCKGLSLMCSNPKCECIKLHSDCKCETSFTKLLAKLQSKGNNSKFLLGEIYSWYQNQSKLIAIEMEYLKKTIDTYQFKLFGDEEKLYNYLIEGKSDLILPSFVADVQKILYDKNDNNFEKKVDETKSVLEKEEKEIKNILENVRKLIEPEEKVEEKVEEKAENNVISQNFKFSQELHHPDLALIDDQTVRVSNRVDYGAALLEPSLLASDFTSCKIRLKIKKATDSFFMFGVCQLTPDFKITEPHIYNNIQHGSFTGYGSDNIYVGKSQGHSKEGTNIAKYQANDLIEIQYQKETERVEVTNVTKVTKSVSFIKSDKNLPLYFAVVLSDGGDQVRIVGAKWK